MPALAFQVPADLADKSIRVLLSYMRDLDSGLQWFPDNTVPPGDVVTHSFLPVLVETAKGHDFCRFCLHLTGLCDCQIFPYPSVWSQTFNGSSYSMLNTMASSGLSTTFSTSTGGTIAAAGTYPMGLPPTHMGHAPCGLPP